MAKSQKNKGVSKTSTNTDASIIINQLMVAQLNRGNQTIQTWINNVRSAENTRNPNKKPLLATYMDVEIDLHLKSVMDKRYRAVKTTPWEWQWPNGVVNELVRDNFKAPWFNELLGYIMERIFKGTTLVEFEDGPDGMINDVTLIPRQNVIAHKGIISKDGNSDDGFLYREGIYPNHILEIGKPHELGLLANIAPYVLLKRANLADFSRYNEMFGIPMRWYEYDPQSPGTRDEVIKSAEAHGSAAFVVVPKGTTVNFVESAKQASAFAFDKLHEILNNEITIGVLGQLLTTGGAGGGSYSLGQVHKAVEEGINLEDRLMAEYIINYTFKNNILIPRGYPLDGVNGSFVMSQELSPEKKAEVYLKIADKFPIDPKFLYDQFGIPEPDQAAIDLWKEYTRSLKQEDTANPDPGGDDEPPKSERLTSRVRELYASSCKHRHKDKAVALSYQNDLSDIIERLIQQLFNGEITADSVYPELTDLISEQFAAAVREGFGKLTAVADQGMLDALIQDVQVFSGFKTQAFLRAATDLLRDDAGMLRTFSSFRDEILKLNNEYNVTFLKAEYNHAVGAAQMASKWNTFVKDQNTLPLLQYITAGDSRVRQSHRKLDGITLPVDHPFWDTFMPPNDWNCRCNVKQLASGEQTPIKSADYPQIKDEFKFNPGKQRAIFPKSHPYYDQSQ